MSKQSRTKLVPPKTRLENQTLEVLEGTSLPDQKEDLALSELYTEIECPRCNDIMELNSKFDSLVYFCDSCSFLLKCV